MGRKRCTQTAGLGTGTTMTDASTTPVTIELDRERELRVHWSDGIWCKYPLATLRRACPCAGCREARSGAPSSGLPVVQAAAGQREMATVADIAMVGRYALRITWSDGHSTGIYDFELLRSLCTAPGA
jgi:DUF971 family protein